MPQTARHDWIVAITILTGALACPLPASGQQSSGGRNTGSNNSSSTGASTAASETTIGGSTSRRQNGGQNGQVSRPEFGSFGETQTQDPAAFVGRANTNTFAGQRQAGQATAGNGIGLQFGGVGGQFGALGNIQTGGSTTRGTGQPTTRSRAARLRPQHRVGFAFSPVDVPTLTTRLHTQMRPLRGNGRLNDVDFEIDGKGTLVLSGTANSVDDRELAEAIARLEPGVRRIDNQIVVPSAGPPPSSPSGLP